MIEAHGLTKTYGAKVAVNDLTFSVQPGVVTGFLGPNGSGKSTTMRMIMGLDRPSKGTVTVNGKPFRHAQHPLNEVGALLEAKAIHPGRSAFNHLYAIAAANGIKKSRVSEVLEIVGLAAASKGRAGKFSLGMGQRLGIASALLGDPHVLLFDEPVNGLDPEGILWVRTFLRELASQGRTVLVSSHLMSEMALTADRLIVIGRGALIAESSVEEFIAANSVQRVTVRSPQLDVLADALIAKGHAVTRTETGLSVEHVATDVVGEIAAAANVTLHELSPELASLEDAFMEMTRDAVEYHGTATGAHQ